MRAIHRYALLLAVALVVALCFVGAPRPLRAISGKSLQAMAASAGGRMPRADTLEAAISRGDVSRDAIRLLSGGGFQIVRPEQPWTPGTEALRAVQQWLSASAAGQAHATLRIGEIVGNCQWLARPVPPPPYDRLPPDFAARLRSRDARMLRDCQSLLLSPEIVQKDWLSLAAAQGSPKAAVTYALSPMRLLGDETAFLASPGKVQAWRTRAAAYLWRAAQLGSAEALITLADAYLAGIPVERDPIRAYAFYRAWTRLSPDFAQPSLEAYYAGSLSDAERTEALARSRDIYRACCAPSAHPRRRT